MFLHLIAFSKTLGINHGQGNANFPKMNFQSKIECFRNIFWFMMFLFNLAFLFINSSIIAFIPIFCSILKTEKWKCESVSCSVVSNSLWPHGL